MWNDHGRPAKAPAHEVATPGDLGLVGTPYFWTGMAGIVGVWGAVMLMLWW